MPVGGSFNFSTKPAPSPSPAPGNRIMANRMRTVQQSINSNQAVRPRAAAPPPAKRPPASRMQSVATTLRNDAAATAANRPKAQAMPNVPYQRRRPETPAMTGLQDTAQWQDQQQAPQVQPEQPQEQQYAQEGYADQTGGGGGGGGGGQQQAAQSDEEAQRQYEEQLAAYNEQMAMQGPTTTASSALATVPAPTPTPGIFRRIYNWLFGKKTSIGAEDEDVIAREAANLVIRARKGDQNAMDMIYMVRQSAMKGSPRARKAYACLKDYAYANPVNASAVAAVHYDHEKQARRAALANTALLTNNRIRKVEDAFGSEDEQLAFKHGVLNHRNEKKIARLATKLPPHAANALQMGSDIGYARAVQEVRLPRSRVSKFNPIIGWELGE